MALGLELVIGVGSGTEAGTEFVVAFDGGEGTSELVVGVGGKEGSGAEV